jgi:lipoyl synthase
MKTITIVRPKTQAISVTRSCEQNCVHCQGLFLQYMSDSIDWTKESFLVSGGCDSYGRVPLDVDLIRKLKEHGKKVNVHCGLVDPHKAAELGRYSDAVSFDFVSDNDIIRSVYHLKRTEEDYVRSLQALQKHCHVVPHVMIGLGNESRSIRLLHEQGCREVCFIILMKHPQIKNALTEPTTEYIEHVLAKARPLFERISLGCMRPLARKKEIDAMAIKYVDTIVNPAVGLDLSGFAVIEKDACCALP